MTRIYDRIRFLDRSRRTLPEVAYEHAGLFQQQQKVNEFPRIPDDPRDYTDLSLLYTHGIYSARAFDSIAENVQMHEERDNEN